MQRNRRQGRGKIQRRGACEEGLKEVGLTTGGGAGRGGAVNGEGTEGEGGGEGKSGENDPRPRGADAGGNKGVAKGIVGGGGGRGAQRENKTRFVVGGGLQRQMVSGPVGRRVRGAFGQPFGSRRQHGGTSENS